MDRLWLETRDGGAEDMAAALFLHESYDAQIIALPCRIQFQVGFATERRRYIGVGGARFVQPAHHRRVMQIVAGIFTSRHGGMQRRFRDGQPDLRDIALLRSLELSDVDLDLLVVVLI